MLVEGRSTSYTVVETIDAYGSLLRLSKRCCLVDKCHSCQSERRDVRECWVNTLVSGLTLPAKMTPALPIQSTNFVCPRDRGKKFPISSLKESQSIWKRL